MGRSFPRAKPGDRPTEGGLDELLPDPPEGPQPGSLRAYAEGSRVRRRIYVALGLGSVAAVVAGVLYVRWLDHRAHNPIPEYQLAEGAQDEVRPRTIEWSSGFARLGLSRTEPVVDAIVLPDRIIRLHEDSDHAQVKVHVVDGRTVELKVITGEITVEERPGSPPAPPATAP